MTDETSHPSATAKWALFVAMLSLLVSGFGYSPQIFGFFNSVLPLKAQERNEHARRYFEILLSEEANRLRDTHAFAKDGSPADAFADSKAWLRLANTATLAGQDLVVRQLHQEGSGFVSCDPADPSACQRYTDLSFDDQDLLLNFQVDGLPLTDFYTQVGDSVQEQAISVTPLAGLIGVDESFYAFRVLNKTGKVIKVDDCAFMDTVAGHMLVFDSAKRFPVVVRSWQEKLIYCHFKSSTRPAPVLAGVLVERMTKKKSSYVTVWATFS